MGVIAADPAQSLSALLPKIRRLQLIRSGSQVPLARLPVPTNLRHRREGRPRYGLRRDTLDRGRPDPRTGPRYPKCLGCRKGSSRSRRRRRQGPSFTKSMPAQVALSRLYVSGDGELQGPCMNGPGARCNPSRSRVRAHSSNAPGHGQCVQMRPAGHPPHGGSGGGVQRRTSVFNKTVLENGTALQSVAALATTQPGHGYRDGRRSLSTQTAPFTPHVPSGFHEPAWSHLAFIPIPSVISILVPVTVHDWPLPQ